MRGMRRGNVLRVDGRDCVGDMRELLGGQLHSGHWRECLCELCLRHVPVRGWGDELHFVREWQHVAFGVGIVLELHGRDV